MMGNIRPDAMFSVCAGGAAAYLRVLTRNMIILWSYHGSVSLGNVGMHTLSYTAASLDMYIQLWRLQP